MLDDEVDGLSRSLILLGFSFVKTLSASGYRRLIIIDSASASRYHIHLMLFLFPISILWISKTSFYSLYFLMYFISGNLFRTSHFLAFFFI